MPEAQHPEERPCLHCMMLELIEDFFAENPAMSGEPDTIDTDEVITALAKTVADLTCSQNGTVRQQIIETLMREIVEYDAEFRREDASGAVTCCTALAAKEETQSGQCRTRSRLRSSGRCNACR